MKLPLVLKSFSWRSFVQSCIFSLVLFAILAIFYRQLRDTGNPLNLTDYASIFVFTFFFGLLQWMFQKNILSKLVTRQTDSTTVEKAVQSSPQETDADRTTRKNKEKRLFVHLFSVLQRHGRLMDFLQEDLSRYEDEQIGAAVRSIHENCRKTLDRYLSPEPVIAKPEGERVEIAAGFDQHAIKLVGNVVGQPPFSGILRHRGWQLHTIRLPKLSDTENPNIIAPAEVEIQ
jgi:Domain of unknown function (DUF2760)